MFEDQPPECGNSEIDTRSVDESLMPDALFGEAAYVIEETPSTATSEGECEPLLPSGSVGQSGFAAPTDPQVPVDPALPPSPVRSSEPTLPTLPTALTAPRGPVAPSLPSTFVLPSTPVGPVTPTWSDSDEDDEGEAGAGRAGHSGDLSEPVMAGLVGLGLGGVPFGEVNAAELEVLDSRELLEVLAAWDRVEALAAAGKRAVAAALEERFAPRIVEGRQGRVEIKGQAACEIAIRLGISQQRAALLVGQGVLFNGVLADVGVALTEGVIDAGKAGLFAKALGDEDPAIAFTVMDTVLPVASTTPHARLEKMLQAELVRVDPDAAAKRFAKAMRSRRLEQVQLRPDGMASLRLVAPVFDVARIYVLADAAARATKALGDERTLDQLRADTLLTLVTQHPLPPTTEPPTGPGPEGGPGSGTRIPCGPEGGAENEHGSGAQGLATPTEPTEVERASESGREETPGLVAFDEAAQVKRLVAGLRGKGKSRKARARLLEPPPDDRAPVILGTGPASRLTLLLSKVDIEPSDPEASCLADTYREELYGPRPEATTNSTLPGTPLPAITAPAILGRDVPYLLGFGPIDPTTARALIAEHVTPSTLTITTQETLETEHAYWLTAPPETRHDPHPALQRHLAAYYPTCIAPTCSTRATICDNDHLIEHPHGPTHITNLRPLCRHHHLLKTHAGHRIEHEPNGQLTWITPLGTRRPTQHQDQPPSPKVAS